MAILKRGTGYRIDYRDQRGRRLRRTYRTKKAAETALRTIRDAIEEKSYVAPRDMPTFGTIAEE